MNLGWMRMFQRWIGWHERGESIPSHPSPSHHGPYSPPKIIFLYYLKSIPDFHVEGVGGVKEELDDMEEVVLNQQVDRKQPLVVLTIQITVLIRVTEEESVH